MNNITAHVYQRPVGNRVGGYQGEAGALYSTIGSETVHATYLGSPGSVEDIVDWAKGVADAFHGEGQWVVDYTDLTGTEAEPVEVLHFFQPHSTEPISLDQYTSYLDTEEDEEVQEDEDSDPIEDAPVTGSRLDVVTPITQIIHAAANGLVENIVRDVPRSETDLRERFRAFGLLS